MAPLQINMHKVANEKRTARNSLLASCTSLINQRIENETGEQRNAVIAAANLIFAKYLQETGSEQS